MSPFPSYMKTYSTAASTEQTQSFALWSELRTMTSTKTYQWSAVTHHGPQHHGSYEKQVQEQM